jgi:hypothetical protein
MGEQPGHRRIGLAAHGDRARGAGVGRAARERGDHPREGVGRGLFGGGQAAFIIGAFVFEEFPATLVGALALQQADHAQVAFEHITDLGHQ